MLTDPMLSGYFDGVDAERQAAKLAAFLRMALGGPGHYTGTDLRTAHARLDGLGDEHVDRVIDHLKATLRDLGAAEPDVRTAAGIVGSARDDVLNR
jgi:hemoglobin